MLRTFAGIFVGICFIAGIVLNFILCAFSIFQIIIDYLHK
jgi:hypothetical protein